MSKLLFDKQPLVVDVVLAKQLGLNEAIVIQQVHYWIEINKAKNINFKEGYYWTYNSIKSWKEDNFDFWSVDTVKRTFKNLENQGILITNNFNKDSRDKTKWYRIDYELLEETCAKCIRAKCTNGENNDNSPNALGQNAPMEKGKMHQPLPETTTEINSLEEEETAEAVEIDTSNLNSFKEGKCIRSKCSNGENMPKTENPLLDQTIENIKTRKKYDSGFPKIMTPETLQIDTNVLNTYKNCVTANPNDFELEAVKQLTNTYNKELIIKAFELYVTNKAKSTNYIKSLLEDWTSKGIKTIEELEKHLASWRSKNKQAKKNRETRVNNASSNNNTYKNNNTSKFNDFTQREYDFKQLEKELLEAQEQKQAQETIKEEKPVQILKDDSDMDIITIKDIVEDKLTYDECSQLHKVCKDLKQIEKLYKHTLTRKISNLFAYMAGNLRGCY